MMNEVTEQTCPINKFEAGNSSMQANKQGNESGMRHPRGSDRRYETLSRIAAYLESYMSHDEIDEDSILSLISKLEESRSLRYRMKNIIYAKTQSLTTPIHNISDCEYKSDVENPVSYNEGSNFKSIPSIVTKAYECHIDGDFFFDIIDDIEKDNEDFLLDDETISSLRQSLMITNNGKKRKRRDLKLSISHNVSVFDQDDCFAIRSTSSRPRRGTLRGSEHGSHLEEYDDIHHLLRAMVDSETKHGRSIDLASDIHQELSLKRRLRKRKKKNTAIETRDYDIVKSFNHEVKSTTSPKSKGRTNTKKQVKNHMLSSSRNLKKDDAASQVNILKDSERDSACQKSTEHCRSVLNGVEDPILEWMLLEDRWNLNRFKLEPIRTRHEDSVYGNFSCNLLNSLKGKSRLFARYEFFYSDIDKSWFNENLFHKELISLGISPTAPFKRKEWSAIRRKITKGPPRRFSRKFIDNEFEQLNQYRRRVRTIQKLHFMGEPIHTDTDFEYEVLVPSKVGSMVTAYCHKVHLLHRGIVLSHDYNTGSYLIQFEKKSLGHAWCPDFEVSSHGLQDVIDTGIKNNLHIENFYSSSISRFGKLAQETSFGFIADSLTRMSAIRNAKKTEEHQALVSPSSLSRHMSYLKEISDEIYEQDALAFCMALIDSLIERKEVLLNSIDCINKEMSANSDNQTTSNILQHFDWLIQNYKKSEGALQTALVYLKIIYADALGENKFVPTHKQQKSTNCSRNLVEASDISEELKHAIESCSSELRSKLQNDLADNKNEHQIMDFATYLLAALSILSDADDVKSIVDLKTLQETLNFHLDPLRPSISHRECIPEIIQIAVRSQNESFNLLNTSVNMFLTQLIEK